MNSSQSRHTDNAFSNMDDTHHSASRTTAMSPLDVVDLKTGSTPSKGSDWQAAYCPKHPLREGITARAKSMTNNKGTS